VLTPRGLVDGDPDTAGHVGQPPMPERLLQLAVLVVSGATVGWLGRGLWFFKDDFEFFARRVGGHVSASLWEPHNEHWSTLPTLVYRALYAGFGLRTFLPYLGVLVLVHLGVVTLIRK
jgi:hypothetical protein